MTITARVAQAVRVLTKAAAYRETIQREAAARQAREEQAERERQARVLAEFEDDLARALAEGGALFPGEGRAGTLPGLLSIAEWQRSGHVDIYARGEDRR